MTNLKSAIHVLVRAESMIGHSRLGKSAKVVKILSNPDSQDSRSLLRLLFQGNVERIINPNNKLIIKKIDSNQGLVKVQHPQALKKMNGIVEAPVYKRYNVSFIQQTINSGRGWKEPIPKKLIQSKPFRAKDGAEGRLELFLKEIYPSKLKPLVIVSLRAKFGTIENEITLHIPNQPKEAIEVESFIYHKNQFAELGLGHAYMSLVKKIAYDFGRDLSLIPLGNSITFYKKEGFIFPFGQYPMKWSRN